MMYRDAQHGHAGAFRIDCWRCQVWADNFDPDSSRSYRSNLPRAGRVAPRASRIIGVQVGEAPGWGDAIYHSESCLCRRCAPPTVRFASWLWHQVWCWTPLGQAVYWTLALTLSRFYS